MAIRSSDDQERPASTPVAPYAGELRRIASLSSSGEHGAAVATAQALCAASGDRREAAHLLALCQRRAGHSAEALATLTRLEQEHPGYARLHELRGHCLVDQLSASAAIESYRRALALNPYLADSWSALAALLTANHVEPQATEAQGHAVDFARMPASIRAAFGLFGDGDVVIAEEIVREFLRTHGEHRDGLRLLARLAGRAQLPADAESLLARAVELTPQHAPTMFEYLSILLQRHKHPQVLTLLETLRRREPAHPAWRVLQAAAHAGLGDLERALSLYQELITAPPQPGTPLRADLYLARGHALKALGRTTEAIANYRAAAETPRAIGEAYWGLANLKSYRFAISEIEHMRRELEQTHRALAERYQLCFALGKALEDQGDWAASFGCYESGNRLKHSELGYRPERVEKIAADLRALCGQEFFAARAGFGTDDAAPIFVVGLPRSGSTLVEQILASHSHVDGTMELPHVLRLAQDLAAAPDRGGTAYPAALTDLDAPACRRLGERLLLESRSYRTGRKHYVDKMPNNFLHVGLIHLILPNARIIDVRRGPMAGCFAIYKQLFAAGQSFAYDFGDIARYYRMYEALMAHWDVVLPRKVLRVDYERLVDDLPGTVRRILAFCGLEPQAACLAFHENPRPVHSASAEQVRVPLYRDAIDHWRHFEPWLGPLADALGRGAST